MSDIDTTRTTDDSTTDPDGTSSSERADLLDALGLHRQLLRQTAAG